MGTVKARERIVVTLLVPGERKSLEDWARALRPKGLELAADELRGTGLPGQVAVSWIANDGGFGPAFGYGTVSRAEQQAIASSPGALLLELRVELDQVRQPLAALATTLGQAGALGLRFEESKLGWSVPRFVELLGGDNPWSLYRAAVVVLGDQAGARTCGMHLFSWPDAQVAVEGGDRDAANELLGAFNVFQLVDRPVLRTGETFSTDAAAPRRRLERWPDDGYPPGHPCHNPFGVWRLGAPGSQKGRVTELVPFFMLSLVVLLQSKEQAAGRPLTREEVEKLTRDSPVIALEPATAQDIERTRGFADLEPELIWEQWCLVRANQPPDAS